MRGFFHRPLFRQGLDNLGNPTEVRRPIRFDELRRCSPDSDPELPVDTRFHIVYKLHGHVALQYQSVRLLH